MFHSLLEGHTLSHLATTLVISLLPLHIPLDRFDPPLLRAPHIYLIQLRRFTLTCHAIFSFLPLPVNSCLPGTHTPQEFIAIIYSSTNALHSLRPTQSCKGCFSVLGMLLHSQSHLPGTSSLHSSTWVAIENPQPR